MWNGPCETGRVKRAVKCTFQSGQDVSTSSYTHLYTVQSCSPWNEENFPALRDSTKFSQSPRHFPQWERDGFRMFSVTHEKRQRLNRTDVCWSLFWCEQMHQFASKPFKCAAIKIKEALFETASRILGNGQQIADARSAHVNEQTRSRFVCSPHYFVRWEKQEGWRCSTMFYPFHVHLICFFRRWQAHVREVLQQWSGRLSLIVGLLYFSFGTSQPSWKLSRWNNTELNWLRYLRFSLHKCCLAPLAPRCKYLSNLI